jgi:hypothetical protein
LPIILGFADILGDAHRLLEVCRPSDANAAVDGDLLSPIRI